MDIPEHLKPRLENVELFENATIDTRVECWVHSKHGIPEFYPWAYYDECDDKSYYNHHAKDITAGELLAIIEREKGYVFAAELYDKSTDSSG